MRTAATASQSRRASCRESAKNGTKSGSSGSPFLCLMSGVPMPFEYLRSEAKAGRMGARLMAIVAEGDRSRVYLEPTEEQEEIALSAIPKDTPETDLAERALGFRVQEYGMTKWREPLHRPPTCRPYHLLRPRWRKHGSASNAVTWRRVCRMTAPLYGMVGTGALAYAEAVGVYLGFAVSKCS